jgi:translation elongation factor EF-4
LKIFSCYYRKNLRLKCEDIHVIFDLHYNPFRGIAIFQINGQIKRGQEDATMATGNEYFADKLGL